MLVHNPVTLEAQFPPPADSVTEPSLFAPIELQSQLQNSAATAIGDDTLHNYYDSDLSIDGRNTVTCLSNSNEESSGDTSEYIYMNMDTMTNVNCNAQVEGQQTVASPVPFCIPDIKIENSAEEIRPPEELIEESESTALLRPPRQDTEINVRIPSHYQKPSSILRSFRDDGSDAETNAVTTPKPDLPPKSKDVGKNNTAPKGYISTEAVSQKEISCPATDCTYGGVLGTVSVTSLTENCERTGQVLRPGPQSVMEPDPQFDPTGPLFQRDGGDLKLQRVTRHDDGVVQEVRVGVDMIAETFYKKLNSLQGGPTKPNPRKPKFLREDFFVSIPLYRNKCAMWIIYITYQMAFFGLIAFLAFAVNPHIIERYVEKDATFNLPGARSAFMPSRFTEMCPEDYFCVNYIGMPAIMTPYGAAFPNFSSNYNKPVDYAMALTMVYTAFESGCNISYSLDIGVNVLVEKSKADTLKHVKNAVAAGVLLFQSKCHPDVERIAQFPRSIQYLKFNIRDYIKPLSDFNCTIDWTPVFDGSYKHKRNFTCPEFYELMADYYSNPAQSIIFY